MSLLGTVCDRIVLFVRTAAILSRGNRSRIEALRRKGVKIGEGVFIADDTLLDPGRLFLIEIGNSVTLAPRCHILTHDASMNMFQRRTRIGKVKIKDNCFIGAGAIILPNVTIGPNAIVGAGSVVVSDIPENSVCAGNPATQVCSLDAFLRKHAAHAQSHPCYSHSEYHGDCATSETADKMAMELDNTFGYIVCEEVASHTLESP